MLKRKIVPLLDDWKLQVGNKKLELESWNWELRT